MFNPAEASKNIKDEFIDYIATSFSLSDSEYEKLFRDALNKNGTISRGPMIDIKDIFKSGKSIEELINEGVLSPLFRDLEKNKPAGELYTHKLPLLRPLYLHQEKAINVITSNQHNAVITTGTGSGKTECFLIPVLNELLREKEAGTLNPGVRAIFIYPMNALANDQMKRLREILMYYPDITFGVYNGDTAKKEADAVNAYNDLHYNEACEELRSHLENELISREAMNETPPHILCTNYAMLEHMLLRPENDKIFKDSDFRFVVMDDELLPADALRQDVIRDELIEIVQLVPVVLVIDSSRHIIEESGVLKIGTHIFDCNVLDGFAERFFPEVVGLGKQREAKETMLWDGANLTDGGVARKVLHLSGLIEAFPSLVAISIERIHHATSKQELRHHTVPAARLFRPLAHEVA